MSHKCPACNGKGRLGVFMMRPGNHGCVTIDCDVCSTTGSVSDEQLGWITRGKEFRDARVESGSTMRDSSRNRGIDVYVLSQAERGVIDPKILEAKP